MLENKIELREITASVLAHPGDWSVIKAGRILAIMHSDKDAIAFVLGKYAIEELARHENESNENTES